MRGAPGVAATAQACPLVLDHQELTCVARSRAAASAERVDDAIHATSNDVRRDIIGKTRWHPGARRDVVVVGNNALVARRVRHRHHRSSPCYSPCLHNAAAVIFAQSRTGCDTQTAAERDTCARPHADGDACLTHVDRDVLVEHAGQAREGRSGGALEERFLAVDHRLLISTAVAGVFAPGRNAASVADAEADHVPYIAARWR